MFLTYPLIFIIVLNLLSRFFSWLFLQKTSFFQDNKNLNFVPMFFRQLYFSLASCSWQRALQRTFAKFKTNECSQREKILSLCLSPLSLWYSLLMSATLVWVGSDFVYAYSQPLVKALEQSNFVMTLVASDLHALVLFFCLSMILGIILHFEFIITVMIFSLLLLQQISIVVALASLAGEIFGQIFIARFKYRKEENSQIYFSIMSLGLVLGFALALILRSVLRITYDFSANSLVNPGNLIFLYLVMLSSPFILTMIWGHFSAKKAISTNN